MQFKFLDFTGADSMLGCSYDEKYAGIQVYEDIQGILAFVDTANAEGKQYINKITQQAIQEL